MRVSKLLGVFFLVAAVYVATRGAGWHFGYIAGGMFCGLVGVALLSRREMHPFRVKVPPVPNEITTRPARVVPTPTE
jgi:hypothetical protein